MQHLLLKASFNRRSFITTTCLAIALASFHWILSLLTIPQAFNKMKFFAIAFLMIVLVGSTFGAKFWCGHSSISPGACCWSGERQIAGMKHSSVNSFPAPCPNGMTRKSIITDANIGTGNRCYSCARSAWRMTKNNVTSSMKLDWHYEKRKITITRIEKSITKISNVSIVINCIAWMFIAITEFYNVIKYHITFYQN